MSDIWTNIGKAWGHHRPPMVPSQDVVEILTKELSADQADVLMLGVTPQLARIGKSLTAVDIAPHMIGALWIGDGPDRKAVLGNWLALPLPDASIDAVIGDGCLSALTSAAERLAVLKEVARVLRPGGRVGIRLFTRPDQPERMEDIRSDALSGKIKALSGLVFRLAISIPASGPDYALKISAVGDKLKELFPDRSALIAATGWNPDAFSFVDSYDGAETICTWPTQSASIEEASSVFSDVRLVASGDYQYADRCPILVMRSPRND